MRCRLFWVAAFLQIIPLVSLAQQVQPPEPQSRIQEQVADYFSRIDHLTFSYVIRKPLLGQVFLCEFSKSGDRFIARKEMVEGVPFVLGQNSVMETRDSGFPAVEIVSSDGEQWFYYSNVKDALQVTCYPEKLQRALFSHWSMNPLYHPHLQMAAGVPDLVETAAQSNGNGLEVLFADDVQQFQLGPDSVVSVIRDGVLVDWRQIRWDDQYQMPTRTESRFPDPMSGRRETEVVQIIEKELNGVRIPMPLRISVNQYDDEGTQRRSSYVIELKEETVREFNPGKLATGPFRLPEDIATYFDDLDVSTGQE